MKVRASVKKICKNCKIIKRNNIVRVICVEASINKNKVDLIYNYINIINIMKLFKIWGIE